MFDPTATQHGAVAKQLSPYASVISGGAERHGEVEFVVPTWDKWLAEANLQDAAQRVLGQFDNGRIDRGALRGLARSDCSDTDLLIATLIWGRGKSNGRMRPHIVRVLKSGRRDEVLAETGRLSAKGDVAAAYAAWALPGLRSPFFTKWLWASSQRGEPELRPLILDGRVWATLNLFEWSSLVASGGSRRWPDRYAAYVESCHSWAEQLSTPNHPVSAEDVEYALFRVNGDAWDQLD